MAVVFISPKQRQKMFFVAITVLLVLFLGAVSIFVFLSSPKENQVSLVFNKPKINIDLSIFNSDQFKDLQEFTQLNEQFDYKATDKAGKPVTGLIFADSMDQAKKLLEERGLTIVDIRQAQIGRANPFTPYSTSPATSTKGTTKK